VFGEIGVSSIRKPFSFKRYASIYTIYALFALVVIYNGP
jgi:hypothetical protein